MSLTRTFRAEAVFQVLKGPTAAQSTRHKCGMHTLAGSGAGAQPPTGAGTKAPRAPGTKVAMDSGALLHRARQLPMNTGAGENEHEGKDKVALISP